MDGSDNEMAHNVMIVCGLIISMSKSFVEFRGQVGWKNFDPKRILKSLIEGLQYFCRSIIYGLSIVSFK